MNVSQLTQQVQKEERGTKGEVKAENKELVIEVASGTRTQETHMSECVTVTTQILDYWQISDTRN